jgi:hypothetical protein
MGHDLQKFVPEEAVYSEFSIHALERYGCRCQERDCNFQRTTVGSFCATVPLFILP